MRRLLAALFSLLVILVLAACNPGGPAANTPVGTARPVDTPLPGSGQQQAETPTEAPAVPTQTAVVEPPGVEVASPALIFLQMLDETNGWGLAEGMVLRTLDGGETWYDVTPPDLAAGAQDTPQVPQGFFLDAATGWVSVPVGQDFSSGRLFGTVDGGMNWAQTQVPFAFAQLFFLDAQNGYALASQGVGAGSMPVDVYRTLDGGGTWEIVFDSEPGQEPSEDGLPVSGIKTGLSFLTPERGWVGGNQPQEGYVWLFMTQDGGQTWQHQDLTLPTGLEQAFTSVDPPIFFSEQEGILPVSLFTETGFIEFYRTVDGGQTWELTMPVSGSGAYAVASMQDFWVWDGPTLHVTHDGGQTWSDLTPEPDLSQVLTGIDFVDAETGWALTQDLEGGTQLYRTGDGGQTWTPLFP